MLFRSDINAVNDDGKTPLQVAVMCNNISCIEAILALSRIDLNIKNKNVKHKYIEIPDKIYKNSKNKN